MVGSLYIDELNYSEEERKKQEALFEKIEETQEKYQEAQIDATKSEADTEREIAVIALADLIYTFRKSIEYQEKQTENDWEEISDNEEIDMLTMEEETEFMLWEAQEEEGIHLSR